MRAVSYTHLDVYKRQAYDFWTTQKALEAINYHPAFGINFDPSHLYWQLSLIHI